MSSKSKTKGSSYEREVAKFLSGTYNEPFVRVPNSGAYIGGTNSHRKNFLDGNQAKSFKGDITPPDSWSKFNAECKNYADFPFHLVLTGECKQLDTWLEQLLAVEDTNDLNILFIKITRKGKYVCVQSKLTWISDNFIYYTSKKYGDWTIFEFDSFFKFNTDILKTYSTTDTTSTQQQLPFNT
jgi:hypothetical protein